MNPQCFMLPIFVVLYYTLIVVAIDKEQLGIRLDTTVAQRPGGQARLVYESIVQIQGLSTWEDKEIVDLAMAAHEKVIALWKGFNALGENGRFRQFPRISERSWDSPPGVTTTLVIGDTAYISSTLKGGGYLYRARGTNPRFNDRCKGPIRDALISCQLQNLNSAGLQVSHRTGGNCGEQMAAVAYCASLPDDVRPDFAGAKIVAINMRDDVNYENPQIAKPCSRYPKSPAGTWGCQSFVGREGNLAGDLTRAAGLHVINQNTPREIKEVDNANINTIRIRFP